MIEAIRARDTFNYIIRFWDYVYELPPDNINVTFIGLYPEMREWFDKEPKLTELPMTIVNQMARLIPLVYPK